MGLLYLLLILYRVGALLYLIRILVAAAVNPKMTTEAAINYVLLILIWPVVVGMAVYNERKNENA